MHTEMFLLLIGLCDIWFMFNKSNNMVSRFYCCPKKPTVSKNIRRWVTCIRNLFKELERISDRIAVGRHMFGIGITTLKLTINSNH